MFAAFLLAARDLELCAGSRSATRRLIRIESHIHIAAHHRNLRLLF